MAKPYMTEHDVFAVLRERQDGQLVFHVSHFLTKDSRKACCAATIELQPGESEFAALRRAADAIEAQHR